LYVTDARIASYFISTGNTLYMVDGSDCSVGGYSIASFSALDIILQVAVLHSRRSIAVR